MMLTDQGVAFRVSAPIYQVEGAHFATEGSALRFSVGCG